MRLEPFFSLYLSNELDAKEKKVLNESRLKRNK